MGRTKISSPISSVSKTAKLKRTSFSFKKPSLKITKASFDKDKIINQPFQSSDNVVPTLVETNKILVEIQKQLALDFANRITEKKQLLELSRRSALKQKAVKKEAFVEKGKEKKKFDILQTKVLAPVKGIFDKILDFLALVGTGIVLNTAWEWLSKEENRKKLLDVFKFLADNWKLITGIIVGGFIAKKLYGLYKVFDRLRKLIRFFRGPRSKPGLPGTNTPADCNPILNCLKSPAVVAAMANAVAPRVAGILSGKIKPSPVPGSGPAFNLDIFLKGLSLLLAPFVVPPTTPARASEPVETPAAPAAPAAAPAAPAAPAAKPDGTQLKSSHGIPIPSGLAPVLAELQAEYARTKKPASRLTPQGRLSVQATAPNRLNLGGLFGLSGPDMTPEVSFNPKLTPESNKAAVNQAIALFTVANLPATLAPALSARGAIGRSITSARPQKNVTGPRVSTPTPTQPTKKGQVRLTAEQINPDNFPSSKSMSDKEFLLQLQKEKLEKLFSLTAVGRSMGGLIGGVPSMVDTIPAMLAKGEFIINSMSTKLFKPFLYAINANAGELFNDFIQFTTKFVENVNKKFDLVNDEFDQNKELAELIYELKEREREKKLKEDGTGGGIGRMTSQSSIKPTPKTTPKTIQTYNVRKKTSSSNGQPTIVNMPMPAVNLAGNQTPEAPNTNVHEPSTAPISISSFDSSNPYIAESLADYGIFV